MRGPGKSQEAPVPTRALPKHIEECSPSELQPWERPWEWGLPPHRAAPQGHTSPWGAELGHPQNGTTPISSCWMRNWSQRTWKRSRDPAWHLVGVSPLLEHPSGMLGGERKGPGAAFAPCPRGCSTLVPSGTAQGPPGRAPRSLALGNNTGKALE